MKRSIKRDIRWNQYEIDRIDAIRGTQDFSDLVRSSTMEAVYKLEQAYEAIK